MITPYKKADDTVDQILNDLIRIHNDRIAGYEQALLKIKDADDELTSVFESIIAKAERCRESLSEKIKSANTTSRVGVTLFGKIYRAWVDLKMTLTGENRKAVVTFCLYNEDIAQHACRAALNPMVKMRADVRAMIEDQQDALEESYRLLKDLRDRYSFAFNERLAFSGATI